MSAIVIAEASDRPDKIQVLFALHQGMDTLDFTGPLETLSWARHNTGGNIERDSTTRAFNCVLAAENEQAVTAQGVTIKANMDFEEAHYNLSDFDVMIVPGGGTEPILKANNEPMKLIKAFAELQKKDPSKERTLLSVCTGSLFLAQAGVLQGMSATTHPFYYTQLEILCQEAARKGDLQGTNVMEERYVVNNARFALGENEDENPFILKKRPDGRRKSIARKGSDAWKDGRRRESVIRRASMKLGGLRLITAGGVSAGIDASLYLVSAMVSHDSALEVAKTIQYDWQKGVTVEGIDV
ncbi:uncharacterized protein K452DRAFT_239144 [Aplosporella prunicola CBS 121167]|uniref:DJ-1/PfpI domain-containing protein n=1 Tax=Aplosporella prunicola CBS 121167 TaxID=1176127 RepID=A0A6A6AVF0_9PEZI|nr:uncharacterized protein K452DRAFT_239144 [Aplosporella prunicola CBS 121167]KAF2135566.1 hypothetical protein K452DRAFT_239144 [Aplosporella prunicola CBS 121167]